MTSREQQLSILKAILAFAILSTGLHFTHNFVEIDQYPAGFIGEDVIQAAIPITWPLYTVVALLGYRLYARGRLRPARIALVAYGLFAMTSLLHFTAGTPDVPVFWFVTIFTDGLAGLAVLAFTAWSARVPTAPAT